MIHCYGEATSQVNVNYASTQNYEMMFTLLTEPGIEDLRLVNGTYGSHMGRVEVLYNGTWGTICNSGWRWPEARAACKYVCYRMGGSLSTGTALFSSLGTLQAKRETTNLTWPHTYSNICYLI